MANSRTIHRESMSADSTAAGSRSVSIHRITSSTQPVKRSITPSPRTLRTEAQAAAALPVDLSGLEGVIHSLLLSALEKIADRMARPLCLFILVARRCSVLADAERNGGVHVR
jgi:hypothetical protein